MNKVLPRATAGEAMIDLQKLERERMLAAEKAVVDSIPEDIRSWLKQANERFATKGGCPGCGSKLLAVHNLPCSVLKNTAD